MNETTDLPAEVFFVGALRPDRNWPDELSALINVPVVWRGVSLPDGSLVCQPASDGRRQTQFEGILITEKHVQRWSLPLDIWSVLPHVDTAG